MGPIAFVDHMPEADRDHGLNHRQDVIYLAAEFGIIRTLMAIVRRCR